MRRLALVWLVFAFAGCGVLDDEGPALTKQPDPAIYGPTEAVPGEQLEFAPPELRDPSPEVARALDDGAIAVVDLTGTPAIEPSVLETASDQRLQGIRWSRWGEDGAEGRGQLRALTCRPTCATGGFKTIAARITLHGVKVCSGRRYFERAELHPSSGPQPANYLRAPC